MEDTYCVTRQVAGHHNLFCVFDGHGGKDVADLCAEHIPKVLTEEIRKHFDIPVAIRSTFHLLDDMAKVDGPMTAGCTAAIALSDGNRLWFANCGDAMSMVSWKSSEGGVGSFVSQDHKVEHEAERIRAAGGSITYDDGCARINRMLNIARSIGDHHLKRYVIANPYITSVHMDKIKYVLIASDGLWDVYKPVDVEEEIDMIVSECKKNGLEVRQTIDTVTRRIVENAFRRGSTDNITVIYLMPNV